MKKALLGGSLFAVLVVGAFFFSSQAFAATITVTSQAEGTVVGQCTLRDAVQAANSNTGVQTCTAGGASDTITVPAGTYNLTTPLALSSNIVINGANSSTTIINGSGIPDNSAIAVTGQLNNPGAAPVVTLNNLTVEAASHDGIYTLGKLTVTNSVVRNNKVSGITADNGYNTGASLTLTNVDVFGTTFTSSSFASGVSILGPLTATLDKVSIHDNVDQYYTAGLNVSNATLNMTNSTVSNNRTTLTSQGFYGSAGVSISQNSTATILNSTISGNSSPAGALGVNLYVGFGSTVQIKNTIVNGNIPSSCLVASGTITSQGDNLYNHSSCGTYLNAGSDISGTELFLAPLAYGTSLVPTHALLKGSPAINAGTNTGCPSTDARGVTRPYNGGTCDIGAYELDKTASVALFRFFNNRNGEHFFTIDANEANFLRTDPGMNVQWNDEGISFPVEESASGTLVAVHRFVQASTGYHHFTKDLNEVSVLQGIPDFTYEGIKFYAEPNSKSGTSPVYRFFNKINGAHLFTISDSEADFLRTSAYGQQNWNDELIEYHVFRN